jgi:hypothetical protein
METRLRRLKCILLASLLSSGCGRAPSFNVLGSYFPAWLLCIFTGVAGASIVASTLSKLAMRSLIRWDLLVYPCLAASITFTVWLLLFS